MLTLTPGASCDVCAEEYGPNYLPHSIPCGHILCSNCCNNIAEKAPLSRLAVVCPFCREPFTPDTVRLIRPDFSSSSSTWTTPKIPKFSLPVIDANIPELPTELWTRNHERMAFTEDTCSRVRAEARRLEDRVAKVAQKKSSVEEVSNLHKELEAWLNAAVKSGDQTNSLYLSAALLRAILLNHVAHSEATKAARNIEHTLKVKIDDMQLNIEKLEGEIRKMRLTNTQKTQECQDLRAELSRLKGIPLSSPMSASMSESRLPTTPPRTPVPFTSSASAAAAALSPLSRTSASHGRSASMQHSLRSVTPSPQVARSHTPIPRSHTSLAMHPPTSAPPVPALPANMRSHTPGPMVPPKPRRLSTPSPPTIARTISEEKRAVHERWIPPTASYVDNHKSSPTKTPISRASSVSYTSHSSIANRMKDVRSPPPH